MKILKKVGIAFIVLFLICVSFLVVEHIIVVSSRADVLADDTNTIVIYQTFADSSMLTEPTLDNLWMVDENNDGISDNGDALIAHLPQTLRVKHDGDYYVADITNLEDKNIYLTDYILGLNDDYAHTIKDTSSYIIENYQLKIDKDVFETVTQAGFQLRLQTLYVTEDPSAIDLSPVYLTTSFYTSDEDILDVSLNGRSLSGVLLDNGNATVCLPKTLVDAEGEIQISRRSILEKIFTVPVKAEDFKTQGLVLSFDGMPTVGETWSLRLSSDGSPFSYGYDPVAMAYGDNIKDFTDAIDGASHRDNGQFVNQNIIDLINGSLENLDYTDARYGDSLAKTNWQINVKKNFKFVGSNNHTVTFKGASGMQLKCAHISVDYSGHLVNNSISMSDAATTARHNGNWLKDNYDESFGGSGGSKNIYWSRPSWDENENSVLNTSNGLRVYMRCVGIIDGATQAALDNNKTYGIFLVVSPTFFAQAGAGLFFAELDIDEQPAYVCVTKNTPTGYSGKGATFGLYKTEADARSNTNRITTLTIGNNNKSQVYELKLESSNTITLYAKELTVPSSTGNYEWIKDDSIKSISVTSANNASNPATFTFTNNVKEFGYAYVNKSVPTGYSAAGAEYTIYTNSACTTVAGASYFANGVVQKFTIGANGNSNTIKFNVPTGGTLTLYVKETKKPTQAENNFTWKMDTNVYTIRIGVANSASNPVRVNSSNSVTETFKATVSKSVDKTSAKNLAIGAQFTLYYSNGAVVKDVNGTNCVFTVSKDGSGNLVTETYTIPIPTAGSSVTVTLKETKVPTGFSKAADQTITLKKGDNKTFNVVNHYTTSKIYVIKSTDRTELISTYPITGTQFTIYTNAACTTIAKDINTNQNAILTCNANGTTNQVELPLGTYYIKETKVTEWYEPDTAVKKIIANNDGETYIAYFVNKLKPGTGQVEKKY